MRIKTVLKRTVLILLSLLVVILIATFLVVRSLVLPDYDKIGNMKDEALQVGRMAESFTASADPYFIEMDKGLLRKGDEDGTRLMNKYAKVLGIPAVEVRERAIKGQNTWIMWSGGNDRLWDLMASTYSFGTFDLLKTVSSNPDQGYGRYNRWAFLGLVNEPCYEQARKPNQYGLWLDQRSGDCDPDPFADEEKYPGVAYQERGKKGGNVPLGSFYGESTGVIGLRLFPNPYFDEEAQENWDPERYYNDPKYYADRDLVRPYRVGMSCAFCHVGPSPVNAPADPENPEWENLASNPGAQYFWVNRIFFWNGEPRKDPKIPAKQEHNFVYQLFHTNPPGTLDTSLISTDYMNNPRTMNAVYSLGSRLAPTLRWGSEKLSGGQLDNKQFTAYEQTKMLGAFWNERTGETKTARVLKDGSDSVGVLGALNRVYLNIGLFSEEWLEHFIPVVGGQKITPIKIADAQKNSSYWNATEDQTADMAIFFLATATPDDLQDAPYGKSYLTASESTLRKGKITFAENCAVCHSSHIPPAPVGAGIDDGNCLGGGNGKNYRSCWDRYWAWSKTDEFKAEMTKMVLSTVVPEGCPADKDPFLCENFLSTEKRVPVDLLQTNACGPIATNALAGDIWDNFSSDSYKQLPAVAELTVHHPVSGGAAPFSPLGNGRGYTRPASLISLWSSAPFLLNNSVGHPEYYPRATSGGDYSKSKYGGYDEPYNPAIKHRLAVFDDSINKMLNPELRRTDKHTTSPVPGYMYRTSAASCVKLAHGYLPDVVQPFTGIGHWLAPWAITEDGDVALGPFPEDFPTNLVVNTKLIPDHDEPMGFDHLWKLLGLGVEFTGVMKELGGTCDPEQLRDTGIRAHAKEVVYSSDLVDQLLINSKCPDYVVNRGHYFGSDLTADEKAALIEYLKTF